MKGFIEIAMFLAWVVVWIVIEEMGGGLGLMICAAWAAIGMYMVAKSKSRGFVADMGFVFAWPFYILFDR
jgi:hypothetical protein